MREERAGRLGGYFRTVSIPETGIRQIARASHDCAGEEDYPHFHGVDGWSARPRTPEVLVRRQNSRRDTRARLRAILPQQASRISRLLLYEVQSLAPFCFYDTVFVMSIRLRDKYWPISRNWAVVLFGGVDVQAIPDVSDHVQKNNTLVVGYMGNARVYH